MSKKSKNISKYIFLVNSLGMTMVGVRRSNTPGEGGGVTGKREKPTG